MGFFLLVAVVAGSSWSSSRRTDHARGSLTNTHSAIQMAQLDTPPDDALHAETRHDVGCGPTFPETFVNPPQIRSKRGTLQATLTISQTALNISGQTVVGSVYNGLYIPPVLRVFPGDSTILNIINDIDQMTNLHHHGSIVSPLGNSDNVFVDIMPGEQYQQVVNYPQNHPPGMLWYHPHMHGLVEGQIFGGMSGGLIVEGILNTFPQLRGVKERIMLLKDFQNIGGQIPGEGSINSDLGTTRTINGVVDPTISISPGETQFWRIGNIGADIFYRLKLDNGVFYEIARDGQLHNQLVTLSELIIPPGGRSEVLVRGGKAGISQLRTLYYDEGVVGDQYPEVTMATVVTQGCPQTPVPLPSNSQFPAVPDLRSFPIAMHRTFVFSENPNTNQFYINGMQFDPNVVNTTVKLGTVEEWQLVNASDEQHVFHIHQLHFQVTARDGNLVPFIGRQDVAIMPMRSTTTVLLPFLDPVQVGKFVYHCHITNHEDNGMMQTIEVVP
jgi:FtsP/CotA-like multicopper oxidase with cupredoxin domain